MRSWRLGGWLVWNWGSARQRGWAPRLVRGVDDGHYCLNAPTMDSVSLPFGSHAVVTHENPETSPQIHQPDPDHHPLVSQDSADNIASAEGAMMVACAAHHCDVYT